MTDSTETPTVRRLPILPLRDVVVYPHTVIPLFVGRERSVAALDQAMAGNARSCSSRRRSPTSTSPGPKDIYEIGTLATILQLLKLPDGTVKVLVEGIRRARLRNLDGRRDSFTAEAEELPEGSEQDRREMDVLTRSVMSRFEQYVKLNKKIPPEILTSLVGHRSAGPARRHGRGADGAEALREAEGARDRRACGSASSTCSASSTARSTCCRSRSASAAASSSRWRRASASTTSTSR